MPCGRAACGGAGSGGCVAWIDVGEHPAASGVLFTGQLGCKRLSTRTWWPETHLHRDLPHAVQRQRPAVPSAVEQWRVLLTGADANRSTPRTAHRRFASGHVCTSTSARRQHSRQNGHWVVRGTACRGQAGGAASLRWRWRRGVHACVSCPHFVATPPRTCLLQTPTTAMHCWVPVRCARRCCDASITTASLWVQALLRLKAGSPVGALTLVKTPPVGPAGPCASPGLCRAAVCVQSDWNAAQN